MRITDGRLDKLFPALTAKERALLVLRAWKQDEEEDRRVRLTMPDIQVEEFNRLIGLMNGCYMLGSPIGALGLLVTQLGLRYGWLLTLDLWAIHSFTLADYIWSETKEPITESEYGQRLEAARAEMVPASELAELLTEDHEGWAGGDLKESDGETIVTDAAWKRVAKEKERQLASLVSDGVLDGKRKGKRLLVSAGSFYDWLGEEAPLLPDWGLHFDVLPDGRAEEVERHRRAKERARQAVLRGPSFVAVADGSGGASDGADRIRTVLEERLRAEASEWWQALDAVEKVVGELAREFDGEDPLLPAVREVLDDARARLDKLVEELGERLGPLELTESPEWLKRLRRHVGLRSH